MDCSLILRARQAVGDKGLVTANTHGSFNILGMFRKLDDILTDPLTDEGFYRAMVEFFLPRLVQRAKKMVENGADVIEVAGHCTGQVGPKTFQKCILEYENRLTRAIHEIGPGSSTITAATQPGSCTYTTTWRTIAGAP